MFGEDKPDQIGKSQNLSPAGICIISDRALPTHSKIVISINVKHVFSDDNENWENITVYGKVVWVDTPPGIYSVMGVEFDQENEKLVRVYEIIKSESQQI